jgi:hypothetical protein
VVVFVESAFKHGYGEEDFYEVLERSPVKLKSSRGLAGVYELYGRNFAGDYLHIAYRRSGDEIVVFHMRGMSSAEKKRYRQRWQR